VNRCFCASVSSMQRAKRKGRSAKWQGRPQLPRGEVRNERKVERACAANLASAGEAGWKP
jgi:hypothetical protein